MAGLTNFEMVTQFNRVLGQGVADKPMIPDSKQQDLRMSLIQEEVIDELDKGFIERDLLQIADAIGDGLVVLYGAANDCGLDADAIVREVHRSNMSKLADNKDEALLSCARYAMGNGFHGKYHAIEADYRPCQVKGLEGKFIIFDMKSGKTLKSVSYSEPKLAQFIVVEGVE